MNVLQAIRWGIEVWEEDVTDTTINNCWVKSKVLSAKYGPQTREEAEVSGWNERVEEDVAQHDALVSGMAMQIRDLARQNRVAKAMSISQFLNPAEEEVYDSDEVIVDDIVNAYSTEERRYETDEEDIMEPRVRMKEAIEVLQTLRLYEEQHDDRGGAFISGINRHERVIRRRHEQELKQTAITEYFI